MSRDRNEFAAFLARQFPRLSLYNVGTLAAKLIRIGKAQSRDAIGLCNIPNYEPIYDRTTEKNKKALARLVKELELGKKVNFSLGGDPRGATLRIVWNDGHGEREYAVPGS